MAIALAVILVAGCSGAQAAPAQPADRAASVARQAHASATPEAPGPSAEPDASAAPPNAADDPTATPAAPTPTPEPLPEPATTPTPTPEPLPEPATTPTPTPEPTPTPTPTPEPTPTPTPAPMLVPLVPVTGFWSTERSITRSALTAAVAGRGSHPRLVLVSTADLRWLTTALRVTAGRNVRAMSPAKVRAAVAKNPGALGILRAQDVRPDVRALAVGGVTLFGEGRLRSVAKWPLLVPEAAGAAASTFAPASLWTLAAGGDVMLDRSVYRLAVLGRKGADYPWAGGTASVAARFCCGAPGFRIVTGRRTGHAGAVRMLLRRADVAIVNLEGPAPNRFSYHPLGYVFTMDPKLLVGLRNAGIDAVSLANNHILNAGARGVADTIRNLDKVGLAHFGAGKNAAAARRPAWLRAAGMRIAVLGFSSVTSGGNAGTTSAGAARLSLALLRADIRAARRAGADVVIVVPHWGREYTDVATAQQRQVGAALVAAGADLVLGSHSHWAGPLQLIDGHLVVYSFGDLLFDLRHDERTQEGLIAELTFSGRRLVQVDLHPTLIVDSSQVTLLDAAGGGNALLRAIRAASARLGR